MGQARVFRKFAASSDAVWQFMSWRGMKAMAGKGLFAAVEFESDRDEPGATKRITMISGATVRERLEWVDEAARAYSYRILDTGGIPVANYEAIVRVTGLGPAASAVVISCSFVAIEASDDEYAVIWTDMEDQLLAQIAGEVEVDAVA